MCNDATIYILEMYFHFYSNFNVIELCSRMAGSNNTKKNNNCITDFLPIRVCRFSLLEGDDHER
jgi:hypothetical protein